MEVFSSLNICIVGIAALTDNIYILQNGYVRRARENFKTVNYRRYGNFIVGPFIRRGLNARFGRHGWDSFDLHFHIEAFAMTMKSWRDLKDASSLAPVEMLDRSPLVTITLEFDKNRKSFHYRKKCSCLDQILSQS